LRGITLQTPTRFLSFIVLICACGLPALADPIPVRHQQGTVHGFLELRSDDGRVLASGDIVQVARGDQVTARVLFRFKDGSIDDETTVFSQRRTFRLISDRRIQKGPFFPHPMDILIDARKNQITERSTGKDGKEEMITSHLDLPADLANGMVPLIVENISPAAPQTTVPMLVATPKPRVVKLVISPQVEDTFSVAGASNRGLHFEIKIDLGGVAGVLAPMIGKQPPDIQLWIVGGEAATFLREHGPIYPDGPSLNIELTSPVWSDLPAQSK
jgi:hypothetical protein